MDVDVARRLNSEIPNSVILDQYSNPNNPLAHFFGTAEEIISSCGDHLDMVVIGAGTGGTISGVAKRLKQKYPGIIVVGVDPIGSILSNKSRSDQLNVPYQVEGIGYDFIPEVLNRSLIDAWIATNDSDSFHMARRLIHDEGLLCGGSSGSAMSAAIQAAKMINFDSNPSKRILIILPDSVRNYMTKFLSSEWMFINNFMKTDEFITIQGLNHVASNCKSKNLQLVPILTLQIDDSIDQIIENLKKVGSGPFPVINSANEIIGSFDSYKLLEAIFRDGIKTVKLSNISRFISKDFITFQVNDDIENVLVASTCKVPIYFLNSQGKAELSSEGQVQTFNPFANI